uniref:Taste receptor type 1 member 3 n=1 Tax=Maylandia zebra TaxID=106582 RepID=A0A3P9CAH7_9CICH
MASCFTLLVLCCFFTLSCSESLPEWVSDISPNLFSLSGDIMLGGLFPINDVTSNLSDITETNQISCKSLNLRTLGLAIAMKYAVDEINRNQTLLTGIKLGYEIYDTCRQSSIIIKPTLSFPTEKSDQELPVQCNYTDHETSIVAVIGPLGSEMVSVIGKLGKDLTHYISYGATSDKSFFRTVPSDKWQVDVMIKKIEEFGWNWVAIVGSDEEYGQRGVQMFTKMTVNKLAENTSVCVAYQSLIPVYTDPKPAIKTIIHNIRVTSVRVVVVFTLPEPIVAFFKEVVEAPAVQTSAFSVYAAVYSVAQALHNLLECNSTACKWGSGSKIYPWKLLQVLKNTSVDINGTDLDFDKDSNPNIGYNVIQEYTEQKLFLNKSLLRWRTNKSACSAMCGKGQDHRVKGVHSCCFDCIDCLADDIECTKCPNHQWSHNHSTNCTDPIFKFFTWNSQDAVIMMLVGMLLLVCQGAVGASGGTLSCVAVLGTMGACLSLLLFLGEPGDVVCRLQLPCTSIFQTVTLSVILSISLQVITAPSAPITTGTTVTFTLHILSSFSLSPWYFSSFSCSFFLILLSFGTATLITTAVFFCLSTTTMSGWLATTILSVCIWKSHRILARSFSTTLGGISHFDLGTSRLYSAQMFLYTMPATWLWRSMYALPASILHPAVMCWIVSGASLHSLHLGSCLVYFCTFLEDVPPTQTEEEPQPKAQERQ